MHLRAGTSGYSYREWKGAFYPADLAASDYLRFYAGQLLAVEINNTFYRMPSESVLLGWREQVPDEFRFVLKASRRITHLQRLKEVGDPVRYLLQNAAVLEDRLGAVLYQLPPNLKCDPDRLRDFLAVLPDGARAAMEFRHESWFDEAVYDMLRERGVALCLADTGDATPELVATAGWGYLRLRGAAYDDGALRSWLERIRRQPWDEAFV
ncbi:MAG: DUF72 domain-containing protein, partial [Planctomycetota bacterium]